MGHTRLPECRRRHRGRGKAGPLKEGWRLARESIASGRARRALDKLVGVTNRG
jgi:anthranilate phosphoribosyltransferase